jgi:hypothetical protein
MVIISFPNGADWYKANWVFRRFQMDIAESHPRDDLLNLEMEKAEALGGLALESMDRGVCEHILLAMKTVAEATVQGKIAGWAKEKPNDENGKRMYLESMVELLNLINQMSTKS